MRTALYFLLIAFAVVFAAVAQDSSEDDNSIFISWVESKLSTDNRKISISGISGALSSNASIRQITIADRQGVWLSISDAKIVWTRTALLKGRLLINELTAGKIEMTRKPVPDKGLPNPETSAFSMPELPISVRIDKLSVASATFSEPVFGQAAELSLDGNILLDGGLLVTALKIDRRDSPGGHMDLAVSFTKDTRHLTMEMAAEEPANGVLANLLKIEGRPSIALSIKGEGPLDGFAANLILDANGRRMLSGTTELKDQDGGIGFRATLAGTIAPLVPAEFRDFFGDGNRLQLAGVVPANGGIVIDDLTVTGGALALKANAKILPDGFLRELDLEATIASKDGSSVVLPVSGGTTMLDRARLALTYGAQSTGGWSGVLTTQNLSTREWSARQLHLDLVGDVLNLDEPSLRSVTLRANGAAEGVSAEDPGIAEALGARIALSLDGRYAAGKPLLIDQFRLAAAALEIEATGFVTDSNFDGEIALKAASLAPFSGLAGRPLSGSANLAANGSITLLGSGFDLALDGRATDIGTGDLQADRLFAGTTAVSGRLARGTYGVRAEKFRVVNPQVEFTADGAFSSSRADFRLNADLTDLNLVDTRLGGALAAAGTLMGENGTISANFSVAVPSGTMMDRPLRDASLKLEGTLSETGFTGLLAGNLFLAGDRATFSSRIGYQDSALGLTDISMQTRGATIAGDITRSADGLLGGALNLDAPDVSTMATLLLRKASGAVRADIGLAAEQGKQKASIEASLIGLRLDNPKLSVGALDLKSRIDDLFGVPAVDASFQGGDLAIAGVDIKSGRGTARSQERQTIFEADAQFASGTHADLAGTLAPLGKGYRLSLERAGITKSGQSLALREPATLIAAGDRIELSEIRFAAGNGSIEARGVIAENLDLQLLMDRVPLTLANLIRPDLAAEGTFGGVLTIGGSRAEPKADFLLRGNGITTSALAAAGIEPVSVDLQGKTAGEHLNLDLDLNNAQGMKARANGRVRLDRQVLDLQVDLISFPLSALDMAAPGSALEGKLDGTALVSGTFANPAVSFDLEGKGIAAAQLSRNGIPPLAVAARGAFSGRTIRLQQMTVSGANGLNVTADGDVPLSGNGLSLDFAGVAPLSIANRFLADRGSAATGAISFDGRAVGAITRPRLSASLSVKDAGFVDPLSNTRLQSIALNASVDGDSIQIGAFTARLATGGSVRASGTISLQSSLPANISVRLENARYADGELVTATVSGDLTISGNLLRDPLIAGGILVHRAELTVPERMAAARDVASVDHANAPAAVRRTIEKALPERGAPVPAARPSVPRLDLRIDAPARVFMRGRGLDTELGGSVTVRGPIFDVQPSGGLEIIRGRLSILGQRIALESGRLTLIGDLDPYVDLTATTSGNDIEVTISVTGRVSDLDISFNSQPELPQDEILSRLLFGSSISSLSPLQLARLAAAAAELAGGGPSILDGVREATGLDDLDIVTEEGGSTTAKAGRYVSDNVYLGVEAGTKGKTKVTIDLDLSDNLKARGSLSEDDSSIGVFFERDY